MASAADTGGGPSLDTVVRIGRALYFQFREQPLTKKQAREFAELGGTREVDTRVSGKAAGIAKSLKYQGRYVTVDEARQIVRNARGPSGADAFVAPFVLPEIVAPVVEVAGETILGQIVGGLLGGIGGVLWPTPTATRAQDQPPPAGAPPGRIGQVEFPDWENFNLPPWLVDETTTVFGTVAPDLTPNKRPPWVNWADWLYGIPNYVSSPEPQPQPQPQPGPTFDPTAIPETVIVEAPAMPAEPTFEPYPVPVFVPQPIPAPTPIPIPAPIPNPYPTLPGQLDPFWWIAPFLRPGYQPEPRRFDYPAPTSTPSPVEIPSTRPTTAPQPLPDPFAPPFAPPFQFPEPIYVPELVPQPFAPPMPFAPPAPFAPPYQLPALPPSPTLTPNRARGSESEPQPWDFPQPDQADNCNCTTEKEKARKRKKSKPRKICWEGTYRELARGTSKHRQRRVSCRP